MQHISRSIAATSAKGVTAAGLLLISPVVLLFSAPLAIGVTSDVIREIGTVPVSLGLSSAVALFALFKLQHPD